MRRCAGCSTARQLLEVLGLNSSVGPSLSKLYYTNDLLWKRRELQEGHL